MAKTMDFSKALMQLKQGKQLKRSGWNSTQQFVYLVPGSVFQVDRPPLLGIYPKGTAIRYRAHLDIKCADGTCVPWLASQTDLLAEDWEIAE